MKIIIKKKHMKKRRSSGSHQKQPQTAYTHLLQIYGAFHCLNSLILIFNKYSWITTNQSFSIVSLFTSFLLDKALICDANFKLKRIIFWNLSKGTWHISLGVEYIWTKAVQWCWKFWCTSPFVGRISSSRKCPYKRDSPLYYVAVLGCATSAPTIKCSCT